MIVTVHFQDFSEDGSASLCETGLAFNMGYATWDEADWNLEVDADRCPVVVGGIQEPVPLHMRGDLHKVYYSFNDDEDVAHGSDKDFMVIYVDGTVAGDSALIEIEDWESFDDARPISLRYPDGSEAGEDFLSSDYMVCYPTNDPLLQIFVGNGLSTAGPGAAVLLNPQVA